MSTFNFSKRTDWLLDSNPLMLALNALKEQGILYIDLSESNPTRCGFSFLNDEMIQPLADADNCQYEPTPQGSLRARAAIAQYYAERNCSVSPHQIVLTSSTSEAYSFLFKLLTNPNDCVLFPKPSYPLFQYLADLNDVLMDCFTFKYEKTWSPWLSHVINAIGPKTNVLVLVNPNNPTGSYIKKSQRTIINGMCRDKQMSIISDEVFWDFDVEGAVDKISFADNQEVLSFTLGGLSKTLAMPQMKLSWIVVSGPKDQTCEALERLEVIADTFLSVNTFAQNALPHWLSQRENIQKEITERIQSNYTFLKEEAAHLSSMEVLKTEGGWNVVLRIYAEVRNDEQWALKLLNKYHVFVYPGYLFDFDDDGFLVLSLLLPQELFREGIKRLLSRIEQEVV